ncbi:MAG: PAS domain-containing protein [bacterium]|nr:MAG: PAS domain-containing protein [bacterium]
MTAPRPSEMLAPRAGPGAGRVLQTAALLTLPLVIVALLSYRSLNVEYKLVEQTLFRQADALARGIEAGTRTGIMHFRLEENPLQSLLDETLAESGALLIAILDGQGSPVYMAQGSLDTTLPDSVPGSWDGSSPLGFFVIEDSHYVYLKGMALPRGRRGGMRRMMGPAQLLPEGGRIAIVLDARDPLSLRSQRLRTTILLALLLASASTGFLGWAFWSIRAREVQAALERTETYTSEVVSRMPAGLVLTATGGTVLMANPAAQELLGAGSGDMRGRHVGALFPQSLLPHGTLEGAAGGYLTEGKVTVADREATISLSVTPVLEEAGQQAGWLLLFQDVTEQRLLAERLGQAERLAELGRLASTVAHEIRNPLSSIRGLAQILESKVSGEPSSLTGTMVQEVDRLNRVVNGLLDYARPVQADIREWEVLPVLEHVRALMSGDSSPRGISIVLDGPPRDVSALFDRDMIIQALMNLTMNAIEASPDGGTVTIGARPREGGIQFTVTDEGPGVAPDEVDDLFGLFTTGKEGGTGLGLPMVRKVADLHGGSASLERAGEEGGTRATLDLPRKEAGEAAR